MALSLADWDRLIKPYLKDMEIDATWVRIYADKIRATSRHVSMMPDFDTNSEAEVQRAVIALDSAIATLQASKAIIVDALDELDRKPLDAA